jgi:ABC-type nitrate/sulfonate/bicarbonate transport system substrate-binding protein
MAIFTPKTLGLVGLVVIAVTLFLIYDARQSKPIRVALSPEPNQSMMAVLADPQFKRKSRTRVSLMPMPWPDITQAVESGRVDIGFASYIEYIEKYQRTEDPLEFVYPAYAFKDGTFITYKADVPKLDSLTVRAPQGVAVWQWLDYRIGIQLDSVFEMMLFHLANTHGASFDQVNKVYMRIEQGLTAVEQGLVDIAPSGRISIAEVEKNGGRAVLTMSDLGFADITGFIVKRSVYQRRAEAIENVIRMWFDAVAYVLRDIDKNSKASLDYLNSHASKRYTLEEFKADLSKEYFPTSHVEARLQLIEQTGRFSARTIGAVVNDYWMHKHRRQVPAELPRFPY